MKIKITFILLIIVLFSSLISGNSYEIKSLKFSPFIHYEAKVLNDLELSKGRYDEYQKQFYTTDNSSIGCNMQISNFFSTVNFVSTWYNEELLPFYFDMNLGYSLYNYSLYCGKIYNLSSADHETLETIYFGIDKDIEMNNLLFRGTAQYSSGEHTHDLFGKDKINIMSLNLLLSYKYKAFFPYSLLSVSKWDFADNPQCQLSLGISLLNPPASRDLIHPATYNDECCSVDKPNIYLYPEQKSTVDVHIEPNGKITKSIPEYGNGWHVTVTPEGLIDNQYNFLFYEAKVNVNTRKAGWCVAKADLKEFFAELLPEYNLNEMEIRDFIDYWTERLNDSPYYTIHPLLNEDIDEVCPVSIFPKPDNLIRLWFVFIPQKESVTPKAPLIPDFQRKGFYVVEWGGILH